MATTEAVGSSGEGPVLGAEAVATGQCGDGSGGNGSHNRNRKGAMATAASRYGSDGSGRSVTEGGDGNGGQSAREEWQWPEQSTNWEDDRERLG